ncbi:MAG: SMI1/KNR4 family protein [Aggregatilineales bacterium]
MDNLLHELKTALIKFESVDLGYPKSVNYVSVNATKKIAEIELSLPDSLASFYSHIDEISLPDVYVGYFVMTVKNVSQFSKEGRIPTGIQREDHREPIIAFGSTGGGDIFAVPQKTGEPVYFLPSYGVTGATFRADINPVYIVADNLDTFLKKIVLDIQALMERKPDWQYLTDVQRNADK